MMQLCSGEVDDEVDADQSKDWDAYWRILFKKVEVKDIQEFEEKYKGELLHLARGSLNWSQLCI